MNDADARKYVLDRISGDDPDWLIEVEDLGRMGKSISFTDIEDEFASTTEGLEARQAFRDAYADPLFEIAELDVPNNDHSFGWAYDLGEKLSADVWRDTPKTVRAELLSRTFEHICKWHSNEVPSVYAIFPSKTAIRETIPDANPASGISWFTRLAYYSESTCETPELARQRFKSLYDRIPDGVPLRRAVKIANTLEKEFSDPTYDDVAVRVLNYADDYGYGFQTDLFRHSCLLLGWDPDELDHNQMRDALHSVR